jgi:hypothetical protein
MPKSKSHSSKSKSKSKKTKKSMRHHRKTHTRKVMRGGDHNGIINLPPAYFGSCTKGYYPAGSPELAGSDRQVSVSQGTMWSNCKTAGPNLYPMMGGGCGCGVKRRNKKEKSKSKSLVKSKH